MNKIKYKLLLLFSLAVFSACNRNVVPGLGSSKEGKFFDEATFNYYYADAIRYKLLGNAGEALKNFMMCLKVNPSSDASYYQMAQIVLNKGDVQNGKRYLNEAIRINPGNLWYLMTLAGLYYEEKNIDSAIYCYEKAVSLYPERDNLQLSLGSLYAENSEFPKARNIFAAIDRKLGVNETSTLALAKVLISEKNFKDAKEKVIELLKQNPDEIECNAILAECYRGEDDNEKAREVYNQLIERNPDNPQIQLSLLDFLLAEKKYEEVLELLNIVILNNKVSREEKISIVAGLIENEPLVQKLGTNLEVAIMVLEANYENDNLIVLMRPELLEKLNKKPDAVKRLEEIIGRWPDNYFAWEKLLLLYYDLKSFDKLFERGEQCATKFNRSFIAKVLYASAALEQEKFDIAGEELRKATILAGDNKEMLLQVLVMQAEVKYRIKDFSGAFETFDIALKYNSEDLTILNNYAYYLAEQNVRLKDAEMMSAIVVGKDKSNTTFLDTYAWVLFKRGKAKEAAKIMERIINSGEKEDAEWFEHYGYILKKLGKCKDATEKWEKAITIDPEKKSLLKEIETCK